MEGGINIEGNASRAFGIISQLVKIDKFHRIAIDSKIKKIGIHRNQHSILMYLSFCGHAPTQGEIAKHFEITPAAVAITLKKLESAHLIERAPQNGNNRANEVKVTDEGYEIVSITQDFFNAVDDAMIDGFTNEELIMFESYLDRMAKNLKEQLPDFQDQRLSQN